MASEKVMKLTPFPADTTREAAWVQIEIYRRMAPEKRLRQALEMSEFARMVSASGVRQRHPDYTEEQVRLTVVRYCVGDDLFSQAYPGVHVGR
jgi:hypothetical protein